MSRHGLQPPLAPRLAAEAVGTALLLAVVVGSGIMGTRLSGGDAALALLANAGATAAGLYVLIAIFAPVSGAHFNPLVTLAAVLRDGLPAATACACVVVQLVAAIAGVLLAHAMFGEPLWQPGDHIRTGYGQWLGETVATSGLLLTIQLGARHRPQSLPALVAAWIFAAYWFTSSTSFANPAVTVARALTRSFAGIRPEDVAGFVLAQAAGATLALLLARVLVPVDRVAELRAPAPGAKIPASPPEPRR